MQRAEDQLTNEHIISINNTIDMCMNLRYTCIKVCKDQINTEIYERCYEFIKKVRECRHKTILERHLSKFNQLCQQTKDGYTKHLGGHSNNYHATTGAHTLATTTSTMQLKRWVKNLLGVSLNKAQV